MNYIDIELLSSKIKEIEDEFKTGNYYLDNSEQAVGYRNALSDFTNIIDSLQQEQPDFPTTDEQMKEFLATHPKIEVPEKYKNPDWLFKKQEQPKVDLVAKLKHHLDTTPKEQLEKEWKELEPWCNIGPTVQEFLYGKQSEVDLEKEINRYFRDECSHDDEPTVREIASHFYELGRQAKPEVFDTVAFQKGVQEGRRLEREDVKSLIQSRIDEILGDAQPNPILRMELQELIKKIEE